MTMGCSDFIIPILSCSIHLGIQYRPPDASLLQFYEELANVLEQNINSASKLLLMGDLNVQVNSANNTETITPLDTLDSFGLKNHVNGFKYYSGCIIPHIPDLTRITTYRSQQNTLQTVDTRQNQEFEGNLLQKTQSNQHRPH